eukprot:scaffold489_cov98-Cylindrotheca_fusiformis.AAC.2
MMLKQQATMNRSHPPHNYAHDRFDSNTRFVLAGVSFFFSLQAVVSSQFQVSHLLLLTELLTARPPLHVTYRTRDSLED